MSKEFDKLKVTSKDDITKIELNGNEIKYVKSLSLRVDASYPFMIAKLEVFVDAEVQAEVKAIIEREPDRALDRAHRKRRVGRPTQ